MGYSFIIRSVFVRVRPSNTTLEPAQEPISQHPPLDKKVADFRLTLLSKSIILLTRCCGAGL